MCSAELTEEKKSEIIQAERKRLLADGVDGKTVMKMTTGKNREKIIAEYFENQKSALDPVGKSDRDILGSKNTTENAPDLTKDHGIDQDGQPVEILSGSVDTSRYSEYAHNYALTLGEDGLKKLCSKEGNYFSGLILYISRHENYGKELYESVDDLWEVWQAYEDLCYMFSQKPIIEEYAKMIGISRSEIYRWANGEARQDRGEKVGLRRCDTIKRMMDSCRIGRYKLAATGNVGGIFLCKAVDGMVETSPAPVYNPVQVRDNLELSQKLGLLLSDNSES